VYIGLKLERNEKFRFFLAKKNSLIFSIFFYKKEFVPGVRSFWNSFFPNTVLLSIYLQKPWIALSVYNINLLVNLFISPSPNLIFSTAESHVLSFKICIPFKTKYFSSFVSSKCDWMLLHRLVKNWPWFKLLTYLLLDKTTFLTW